MHERIAINPKVCHGQACVKGTRIQVHQVFRMLPGDILACFDDAASLAEEEVTPLEAVAGQ
ncbi:MAG: DUF433 domain-containing protein [Verrucomicrobia bacterium]|nr:DUF433 domain-containing protein [Verrucomicrobiota bacterium]